MGQILNRRRVMGGNPTNPFIQFADPGTKAFCVEKFGGADGGSLKPEYRRNGIKIPGIAGEVTYEQAASFIHCYYVFFNNLTLGSFDEFAYFTGLTKLEQAFSNSSITSIVVPDTVSSMVDNGPFKGCQELVRVILPEGLRNISSYAFYGCKKLSEINIPSSVSVIGEWAFRNCAALREIYLPEGLTEIPGNLFQDCSSLTRCNIPASVRSIGASAFQNAPITGHLEIPYGVTSIEYGTFWNTKYTSVTIPESVVKIDEGRAFSIPTLVSVTLPSSLESLGKETFFGCSSLASIRVMATTPPSGVTNGTWRGIPSTTMIEVPPESVEAYKADQGWSNYANRIIAMSENSI